MKHGGAGRKSNRARPAKERRKILKLVREKYSGDEKTRFGPTLAAEHLASEDELEIHPETLRRWMLVTRDAHALYEACGFTALAHPARHMERTRADFYLG